MIFHMCLYSLPTYKRNSMAIQEKFQQQKIQIPILLNQVKPSHFPQDSENTTNNDNLKPSILETRNLNLIKKSAQLGFKFVILKSRCDIVYYTQKLTPDPHCIDAINREIISIHEKPNQLNLSKCTSKTKRLSLPSGICKWALVWGSSRWIHSVPWHS